MKNYETRRSIFIRSVWVMLTVLFALFTIFFGVAMSVAVKNSSPINKTFGINPVKRVELGDNEDTNHYPSKFEQKDASGNTMFYTDTTGVKHAVYDNDAMRENSERVSERVAVEGSVLLWNNKNALPLASGSGVSFFGIGQRFYTFTGLGSGYVEVEPPRSLADAVKARGLVPNTVLADKYATLDAKKYGLKNSLAGGDKNFLPSFGVNEAPWSEIGTVAGASIKADDAAVMIISREAGEDKDITTSLSDSFVGGDKNYLELTVEEANVLENLKELKTQNKLKNIVLMLNTANPMQFKEIKNEKYGIDACVWIGTGGTMAYEQIADILAGHDDYAVSGHAPDTLLIDNRSEPSFANFGDYTWAQYSNGLPDLDKEYEHFNQTHNLKYIAYQEGIYVGYRYYETRYEDYVLDRFGAADKAGATVGTAWNYGNEVAFPFGYGLSYTEFERSKPDFAYDKQADGYIVAVTIRNKGDKYSGKDTLQVYLQKPYTEYDNNDGHRIEKAAVELVGFAKTDLLKVGDPAQTVTVAVDKEALRTYDAYGKKTYILEKGDYYLAVGTDAHDALNNILAAKGYTPENTSGRMDKAGDADMAYKIHIEADDFETYSQNESDVAITNRFNDADLNLYGGTKNEQPVKYLSRASWDTTFPATYVKLKCVNEKMVRDMQYGHAAEKRVGDIAPVYGTQTSEYGRLNLAMMTELEYDNPLWSDLLNQMTYEEQSNMASLGYLFFAGAKSVDAPGGMAADGPAGVKRSDGTGFGIPSAVIMAATFDTALVQELGDALAHEAMHLGYSLIYAPGANIHRSHYGGRNFEYFGEDGFLSGKMLGAEVKGIQDRGIMVMTKHFAFNDQERNRYGVATFFNEQSAREVYLRPFEIAVREYDMRGVMASFNRIGCTWSGAHKGLLTDVLRGEWGFTGIVETDACSQWAYHQIDDNAKAEALIAGVDMWMTSGSKEFFDGSKDNPTVMLALREACHRILYTQLHSAAMNGMSVNTRIIPVTPWWQKLLTSLTAVFGVFAGACLIMAVLSFVFSSKRFKGYAEGKAKSAGVKMTTGKANLIAIISLCAVFVVTALVATLVPVLSGDGDFYGIAPSMSHSCNHVCETCGKCTDVYCENEACADKCGDDLTAYTLEAENAFLENGNSPKHGNLYKGTVGARGFVGNFNGNKGATITFAFTSSEACNASLTVTLTKLNRTTKVTELLGVSVNGGEYLDRFAFVPKNPNNDYWTDETYGDFCLGCVPLKAGYNTISFTVITDGEYNGYNFDKIVLKTDKDLAENYHACGSKCPACGKCVDMDCVDPACGEKCEHGAIIAEAEDAEWKDGDSGNKIDVQTTSSGRKVLGNLNGNGGATITFTVNSDGEKDYNLVATRARYREISYFTPEMIEINGKTYLTGKVAVQAYTDGNWWDEASYIDVDLGIVHLRDGENTIVFNVLYGWAGYNFDKIKLFAHVASHECSDKCSTCGGCKDMSCNRTECAKKCDCLPATLEAEDASWTNGSLKGDGIRTGAPADNPERIVLGWLDKNIGATVTFRVYSATAKEVYLYATRTRGTTVTYFTPDMVKVNGKTFLKANVEVEKCPDGIEQNSDGSFIDVDLGTVRLDIGWNTIEFIIAEGQAGYNFDKITLAALPITLEAVQNGAVTFDSKNVTVGQTVTLTVTPDTGYALDTITVKQGDTDIATVKGEGNIYTFVMPDGNVTISATFKAVEYTITVDSSQNGTVSASASKATVGTEITLNIAPAEGYVLDTIKVNGSIIVGSKFVMPAEDVTVTATFRAVTVPATKYSISIGTLQNGSVTASVTEAEAGTTITLTVTADAHYKLASLKYNDTAIDISAGGNTFTFIMPDKNVTVTATFEEVKYAVAIDWNGGSGDESSINNSYKAGDKFRLPASGSKSGDEHAVLDKWNDGTSDYVAGAEYTMPEKAVTLTAVWKRDCVSKCSACGGCTDYDCTDSVCMARCGCGATVTLEAEYAQLKEGNAKALKTEASGSRTVVGGFDNNPCASVSFTVNSDSDKKVKLVMTRTKSNETSFITPAMVMLNGEAFLTGNVKLEKYSDGSWWDAGSYIDVDLGNIQLKRGSNTIVFTVPEYAREYNFDKITLSAPETHTCAHKCDDCGGCTDETCYKSECKKCVCKGTVILEAEHAAYRKGDDEINTDENSGKALGGLNNNYRARVAFSITLDSGMYANLIVCIGKSGSFIAPEMIKLNGRRFLQATKNSTSSGWSDYPDLDLGTVWLDSGLNVVELVIAAQNGQGFNLDCIKLQKNTSYTHTCGHVCGTCNKCKDMSCRDPECKNKCECLPLTFEAEDAVYEDGSRDGGIIKFESSGSNTVMCNFENNIGATVTFTVNSSSAKDVKLLVRRTRLGETVRLTNKTVRINGEYISNDTVNANKEIELDAYTAGSWWSEASYVEVDLGVIHLNAGENTIQIIATSGAHKFNFDCIKLVAA